MSTDAAASQPATTPDAPTGNAPPPGTLAAQLASGILQHIQAQALPIGARLSERALAEALRVSRSPVRLALQHMQRQSLVQRRPTGGFAVAAAALTAPAPPAAQTDALEDAYLQIAHDRLSGVLPQRLSESGFMRRYRLTRSQLAQVLGRIAHEGWIARLPGNGWAFSETMTSGDAYEQSYRFRVLVEPACLLEPTYALDAPALRLCLKEQQALLDGGLHTASPAHIFDANTHLHETIARCSGNSYFHDALQRINRIRRLMEYRKAVDRAQARRRCEEHVELIDLVLRERRQEASEYLRWHLQAAAREKRHIATAAAQSMGE